MRAAYGRVVEVKKLRSQGVTRLYVELPSECHATLTSMFDENDVLVTLAGFEVKSVAAYGMIGEDESNSRGEGGGNSGPHAVPTEPSAPAPADFGEYAKRLKLCGFFLAPAVWPHIGSDDDYQAWCRTLPCAMTGRTTDIVYAHVRRANNSGTGIKPEYSGIPLNREVHDYQHQHGELACLNNFKPLNKRAEGHNPAGQAKRWFDQCALNHVERWGWQTLREKLGAESMKHVHPELMRAWCEKRDLLHVLPAAYKDWQRTGEIT